MRHKPPEIVHGKDVTYFEIQREMEVCCYDGNGSTLSAR